MSYVDPFTGLSGFMGRFPKPSFRYMELNAVYVPASEKAPVWLNIGGAIYRVTSNMGCVSTTSGPGGLYRGGSLEASTIYYLYAIARMGFRIW